MKNKILRILTVCLLVLTMPVISYATDTKNPKLSIDSLEVSPGETFDVRINLENNPGIVSANLKIEFDEGLTLIGAANGAVFSTLTYIPPKQLASGNNITSNCQFAWLGFDIADKDIKNGTILTLSFKVTETAKVGDIYNISVYNEKGDVIDKNLNEIILSAKSTVKVIGDADSENTSPMIAFIKRIIALMRKIISLLSTNL